MIVLQNLSKEMGIKSKSHEKSQEALLLLPTWQIIFLKRNQFKDTSTIKLIFKTLFQGWLQGRHQLNEFERCPEDKYTRFLNNKKGAEIQIMNFQAHLLIRFLSKPICNQTLKVERVEEVFQNITQDLHIQETKVLMSTQNLIYRSRRTSKLKFIIRRLDRCQFQM